MNAETRAEERRRPLDGTHVQRYVVLFLWLFVGFFYASMITQWIRANRQNEQFGKSMQHVIQVGGLENRSTTEIRALLLVRADEFSVPIRGDEIHFRGAGPTLKAALHYEADITIPLLNHPVYRMKFDHEAAYTPPNQ